MTKQMIEIYRGPSPEVLRRRRIRRAYEWLSFLVEAFVTVGIMVSFLLCAIVFLCIV